jgi:multidrug transporter EmrE-like cation transporter
MKAAALALALLCVLMSSAAQLAMKLGLRGGDAAGSVAGTYAHALASPLVWLGLALYGLSAALWIWVLSRLDVSLAYPLVSLGFVLTMLFGVQWLGEPFSWQRLAGCGLIVAGVFLLAADA